MSSRVRVAPRRSTRSSPTSSRTSASFPLCSRRFLRVTKYCAPIARENPSRTRDVPITNTERKREGNCPRVTHRRTISAPSPSPALLTMESMNALARLRRAGDTGIHRSSATVRNSDFPSVLSAPRTRVAMTRPGTSNMPAEPNRRARGSRARLHATPAPVRMRLATNTWMTNASPPVHPRKAPMKEAIRVFTAVTAASPARPARAASAVAVTWIASWSCHVTT